VTGGHSALRVAVRYNAPEPSEAATAGELFRCERGETKAATRWGV